MLNGTAVDWTIRELYDVAICRTSSPESLPHGMILKALNPRHGTVKVSLGRARTHNNLINRPLISQVKESRNNGKKHDDIETLLFVFFPDIFQGKYDEHQAPDYKSYEGASRVGQEHESEQDENPETNQVVVGLFGTKEMYEESDINEDEERCRIRSVKYPLKSLNTRTVYPMIDGRSSPKAPVREIR